MDFQLEMEKCKTSRISFNFKISQAVHLTFENLETEMIPKQAKFYEDCFAFTLEAIVSVEGCRPANSWKKPRARISLGLRPTPNSNGIIAIK